MSKPIQPLLAAYADNLVASASLVEERVPVDKVPRGSSDLERSRRPQSDATGPRKWQGGLKNGPF